MSEPCIFTDLLTALEVPHTDDYSRQRFRGMIFHSAFGLSKLLADYGIDSAAYTLADKSELSQLPVPFLAATSDGFVIVTAVGGDTVRFHDSASGTEEKTVDDFCKMWTGTVMMAYPSPSASEPDYRTHRFTEIANAAKGKILTLLSVAVGIWLFVRSGLWCHISTVILTLTTLTGLFVTWHLLLKSLDIHSDTADNICGIIDKTGCHTVLNTAAAKFFGIVSWSEVGFAYFSVTLAALLVFPDSIGRLALINALCCPFSFWSVWYQKYKAKAWCTLCLITQVCLWVSLGCYAFGDWFRLSLPLDIHFFVLAAAYVIVLLTINAISPKFDRHESTPTAN